MVKPGPPVLVTRRASPIMEPTVVAPPLTLTLDERATLEAFASTPAHEARTFPHLRDDLQVVALRLASWGLVEVVNNNVVATAAGRALIAG